MEGVKEEIFDIDIVNVAIILIGPLCRPGINQLELVSRDENYWLRVVDDLCPPHMESMRTSEAGAKFVLRNRLSTLSMGRVFVSVAVRPLLRSLLTVFSLSPLLLLRPCRCRSAFVLVTASFACASWFLPTFSVIWFGRFVFVLGFALFLLPRGRLVFVAFLRISRSGSEQKQQHH